MSNNNNNIKCLCPWFSFDSNQEAEHSSIDDDRTCLASRCVRCVDRHLPFSGTFVLMFFQVYLLDGCIDVCSNRYRVSQEEIYFDTFTFRHTEIETAN